MNLIRSAVQQTLRAFQIIQRYRRLTSLFLLGIWLFVIVFTGLSYFISRDQTQLIRVKFFSYALISLQKVNDLLTMDEIRPSPNSFIFKGRYRKGLLVQGSAALSVMQANRSLLSSVEDRDLQAVLLSYTLLEKGIHLHWREPELFDLNRRIVPRLTALSFAVSQERDMLSLRIDRMRFFRMALTFLSFGGGLIFLLLRLMRNRKVSRQNRFYRALSLIDRLILSLPDQESLLQNTCRIIVDAAHVRTVWIGKYDSASGSGRWVAYDGSVPEEFIRRTLSDDPSVHGGQGIWGHTIRSRSVVVWNDPMTSLPEGYLRDFYRANNIRSAAGFPLMEGETLYGALVVQSDEPDYFDPDLIELISSLVENLSFVLKNLAMENARREAEERLNILIETLPEVIIFKDGEGRWKVVNPAGLRLFKLDGRTDWVNKTDRELALLQPELATVYEGCTLSDNAVWKLGAPSNGIET
ncbi:MAG: GAF domain-containing protein, partial [Leptospirillum sp.]